MHQDDDVLQSSPDPEREPSPDLRLVEQMQRGDGAACHPFFGTYYPDIYRYLLWLTQRPDAAEDLTQQTVIPTRLDLVTLYIPGSGTRFPVQFQARDRQSWAEGW